MIPIMNRPTIPFVFLREFAETVPAAGWYSNFALPALWEAGLKTGVDPTVLAAQCAHETGWGKFGGVVNDKHGNTAGLKTLVASGDKTDDHARFAIGPGGFPWVGALAHAHHLMLYAGFDIPRDSPDERAVFIRPGTPNFGSAPYIEQLGAKWAPSADYGNRVAAVFLRFTYYYSED